jgi:hypothetical protein
VFVSDSHDSADVLRAACGHRRPVRHLRFATPSAMQILQSLACAAVCEPSLAAGCAVLSAGVASPSPQGAPAVAAPGGAALIPVQASQAIEACETTNSGNAPDPAAAAPAATAVAQQLLRLAIGCAGDVRSAFNQLHLLRASRDCHVAGYAAAALRRQCVGSAAAVAEQPSALLQWTGRVLPHPAYCLPEAAALAYACCRALSAQSPSCEQPGCAPGTEGPAVPADAGPRAAAGHLPAAGTPAQHRQHLVDTARVRQDHAAADVLAAWVEAAAKRQRRRRRKRRLRAQQSGAVRTEGVTDPSEQSATDTAEQADELVDADEGDAGQAGTCGRVTCQQVLDDSDSDDFVAPHALPDTQRSAISDAAEPPCSARSSIAGLQPEGDTMPASPLEPQNTAALDEADVAGLVAASDGETAAQLRPFTVHYTPATAELQDVAVCGCAPTLSLAQRAMQAGQLAAASAADGQRCSEQQAGDRSNRCDAVPAASSADVTGTDGAQHAALQEAPTSASRSAACSGAGVPGKRGPGRPRKKPLAATAQSVSALLDAGKGMHEAWAAEMRAHQDGLRAQPVPAVEPACGSVPGAGDDWSSPSFTGELHCALRHADAASALSALAERASCAAAALESSLDPLGDGVEAAAACSVAGGAAVPPLPALGGAMGADTLGNVHGGELALACLAAATWTACARTGGVQTRCEPASVRQLPQAFWAGLQRSVPAVAAGSGEARARAVRALVTMAADESATQAATASDRHRGPTAVRQRVGARRREKGHCEAMLHVMDMELRTAAACVL